MPVLSVCISPMRTKAYPHDIFHQRDAVNKRGISRRKVSARLSATIRYYIKMA